MHKTKKRPDGALFLSLPHLGRGQVPRGAQGSTWGVGSRAAALPRAPGQVAGLLPALPHPAKIAAGGTIPSTAQPHVRAPPPSLQCLVRSQATIHPLDGDDRKPSHLSAPPAAVTQPCLAGSSTAAQRSPGWPKGGRCA